MRENRIKLEVHESKCRKNDFRNNRLSKQAEIKTGKFKKIEKYAEYSNT